MRMNERLKAPPNNFAAEYCVFRLSQIKTNFMYTDGVFQPITTGGVNYRDQPWHKECFVCIGCKQQLAGQRFTSRDDFAYCLDCFCNLFAKKCAYCTTPISGNVEYSLPLSLFYAFNSTFCILEMADLYIFSIKCYVTPTSRWGCSSKDNGHTFMDLGLYTV